MLETRGEIRGFHFPRQRISQPNVQSNYSTHWDPDEMDSEIYDYVERQWRNDRHTTRVPAYPPVLKSSDEQVNIYATWRLIWCTRQMIPTMAGSMLSLIFSMNAIIFQIPLFHQAYCILIWESCDQRWLWQWGFNEHFACCLITFLCATSCCVAALEHTRAFVFSSLAFSIPHFQGLSHQSFRFLCNGHFGCGSECLWQFNHFQLLTYQSFCSLWW